MTAVVHFDSTTRTIIEGRKVGFCKPIADRKTCRILGCHVVGEHAVEITRVAAIAIAAGMRVNELVRVPLSYPTYAGTMTRVAAGVKPGGRDNELAARPSRLRSTESSDTSYRCGHGGIKIQSVPTPSAIVGTRR